MLSVPIPVWDGSAWNGTGGSCLSDYHHSSIGGCTIRDAFDGNTGTRWVASSGTQWIQIDLRSSSLCDTVVVYWETAYASGYSIDISNDSSSWATIHSESSGDGGTDTIDLHPGQYGRYIRLNCIAQPQQSIDNGWGYSIFEIEIWGYTQAPTAIGDLNNDGKRLRGTRNVRPFCLAGTLTDIYRIQPI